MNEDFNIPDSMSDATNTSETVVEYINAKTGVSDTE